MGEGKAVLAVDTERQEEMCCPVEIAHLKEFEFLRIVWDDGHQSDYPLAILRSYCPCSVCGGHGDYSRFERKDFLTPMINAVGDTSLRIAWENGHHTSDYSFTFLRSLCSCHVCQATKMLGG
jgi:DUF971 family protein